MERASSLEAGGVERNGRLHNGQALGKCGSESVSAVQFIIRTRVGRGTHALATI